MENSNDPELDGKQLGHLTENFVKVVDTLKEASYQLKVRGISDYPIFVFGKEEASLGQLLIPKGTNEVEYFINFSFLDEFVQRGLINEENQEEFLHTYKNPDEFACLFVVLPDFINFIFIPYPED